ncbi:hypothetical protein HU200_017012 [Digitaria exilis]|uniref:Uncharacterized protein n=1 Tax=Digitaria exilis TaxID=1010633 RepID=A0A835F7A7_9POAL|nr:hypothetical protein HU200_017012 [Digitaria exilis]
MENMEDVDLEEQQSLQHSPPPSPPPVHKPPRTRPIGGGRALATPARALALVVLVIGLLFSVHLLVHDLRTLALLAAEWLCIFFVMSCVVGCERGGASDPGAAGDGARGLGGAVAEVALWSFAMAVTVTMTFWVAAGLPLPAVAVLYLLSLLAVSACFAVLLDA